MNTINNDLVEQIDLSSTSEFLNEISLLAPQFCDEPEKWIFRGVSNVNYQLVPSALRPSIENKLLGLSTPIYEDLIENKPDGSAIHYPYESNQIESEKRIIRQFYKIADRNGLTIPNDTPNLRAHWGGDIEDNPRSYAHKPLSTWWPHDEVMALMALAQHYGLPTRLLDWTWNPLHAAYFASMGAVRKINNNTEAEAETRMAVWAFAYKQPINLTHINDGGNLRPKIDIVRVPTATNPNLYAQQGLFTVLRFSAPEGQLSNYDLSLDILSLEEQINRLLFLDNSGLQKLSEPHAFICFTLPTICAPELAKKLRVLGIQSGTIYPGFKGSADSVVEERLINKLFHYVRPLS